MAECKCSNDTPVTGLDSGFNQTAGDWKLWLQGDTSNLANNAVFQTQGYVMTLTNTLSRIDSINVGVVCQTCTSNGKSSLPYGILEILLWDAARTTWVQVDGSYIVNTWFNTIQVSVSPSIVSSSQVTAVAIRITSHCESTPEFECSTKFAFSVFAEAAPVFGRRGTTAKPLDHKQLKAPSYSKPVGTKKPIQLVVAGDRMIDVQ